MPVQNVAAVDNSDQNTFVSANSYNLTQNQVYSAEMKEKIERKAMEAIEKEEQKTMQQKYLKAEPVDKRDKKYFKDIHVEAQIDHEAIAYAR